MRLVLSLLGFQQLDFSVMLFVESQLISMCLGLVLTILGVSV